MGQKSFVNRVADKKIWKWYYSIPLGLCAVFLSNSIGNDTLLGEFVGCFNLLILVGLISGASDIARHFRNKKKQQEGFIELPVLAIILAGMLVLGGTTYFVVHRKNQSTETAKPAVASVDSTASSPAQTAEIPMVNVPVTPVPQTTQTPKQPADVCANIEGIQTVVPAGMTLSGTTCAAATVAPVAPTVAVQPPAWDACKNIDGIQPIVPSGMYGDGNGNCLTPPAPPTQEQLDEQATQAEQAKLNTINKQITALSASYLADLKSCGTHGLLPFVEACEQSETSNYNLEYAALEVQFQEVQNGG